MVSDVNPKAIAYVKLTIKLNGLNNRVRYYISDLLEDIPRDLKFDLVIANPPHFKGYPSVRSMVVTISPY